MVNLSEVECPSVQCNEAAKFHPDTQNDRLNPYKRYSKTANKTLTTFANEMSEILRDSIERMDCIDLMVRGCVYEMEHPNYTLKSSPFSGDYIDATKDTKQGQDNIVATHLETKFFRSKGETCHRLVDIVSEAEDRVKEQCKKTNKNKMFTSADKHENSDSFNSRTGSSLTFTTTSKKGTVDAPLNLRNEQSVMDNIRKQYKHRSKKMHKKKSSRLLSSRIERKLSEKVDSSLRVLRENYARDPWIRSAKDLRPKVSFTKDSIELKILGKVSKTPEVKNTKLQRKYANENFHDNATKERPFPNDNFTGGKKIKLITNGKNPEGQDCCIIMHTHKNPPKPELKQHSHLRFCKLLDELTMKDLEPLNAEYPRKDHILEPDKPVEVSLLHNLVHGDTMSLQYLVDVNTIKERNVRMKKLRKPSLPMHHAKYTIPEETNTPRKSETRGKTRKSRSEKSTVDSKKLRNSVTIKQLQTYQKTTGKEVKQRLRKYMIDPNKSYRQEVIVMPVIVQYDKMQPHLPETSINLRPCSPSKNVKDVLGMYIYNNELDKDTSEKKIFLEPNKPMVDGTDRSSVLVQKMVNCKQPKTPMSPKQMWNNNYKPEGQQLISFIVNQKEKDRVNLQYDCPPQQSLNKLSSPSTLIRKTSSNNAKTKARVPAQSKDVKTAIDGLEKKLNDVIAKPDKNNAVFLKNFEFEIKTILSNMQVNIDSPNYSVTSTSTASGSMHCIDRCRALLRSKTNMERKAKPAKKSSSSNFSSDKTKPKQSKFPKTHAALHRGSQKSKASSESNQTVSRSDSTDPILKTMDVSIDQDKSISAIKSPSEKQKRQPPYLERKKKLELQEIKWQESEKKTFLEMQENKKKLSKFGDKKMLPELADSKKKTTKLAENILLTDCKPCIEVKQEVKKFEGSKTIDHKQDESSNIILAGKDDCPRVVGREEIVATSDDIKAHKIEIVQVMRLEKQLTDLAAQFDDQKSNLNDEVSRINKSIKNHELAPSPSIPFHIIMPPEKDCTQKELPSKVKKLPESDKQQRSKSAKSETCKDEDGLKKSTKEAQDTVTKKLMNKWETLENPSFGEAFVDVKAAQMRSKNEDKEKITRTHKVSKDVNLEEQLKRLDPPHKEQHAETPVEDVTKQDMRKVYKRPRSSSIVSKNTSSSRSFSKTSEADVFLKDKITRDKNITLEKEVTKQDARKTNRPKSSSVVPENTCSMKDNFVDKILNSERPQTGPAKKIDDKQVITDALNKHTPKSSRDKIIVIKPVCASKSKVIPTKLTQSKISSIEEKSKLYPHKTSNVEEKSVTQGIQQTKLRDRQNIFPEVVQSQHITQDPRQGNVKDTRQTCRQDTGARHRKQEGEVVSRTSHAQNEDEKATRSQPTERVEKKATQLQNTNFDENYATNIVKSRNAKHSNEEHVSDMTDSETNKSNTQELSVKEENVSKLNKSRNSSLRAEENISGKMECRKSKQGQEVNPTEDSRCPHPKCGIEKNIPSKSTFDYQKVTETSKSFGDENKSEGKTDVDKSLASIKFDKSVVEGPKSPRSYFQSSKGQCSINNEIESLDKSFPDCNDNIPNLSEPPTSFLVPDDKKTVEVDETVTQHSEQNQTKMGATRKRVSIDENWSQSSKWGEIKIFRDDKSYSTFDYDDDKSKNSKCEGVKYFRESSTSGYDENTHDSGVEEEANQQHSKLLEDGKSDTRSNRKPSSCIDRASVRSDAETYNSTCSKKSTTTIKFTSDVTIINQPKESVDESELLGTNAAIDTYSSTDVLDKQLNIEELGKQFNKKAEHFCQEVDQVIKQIQDKNNDRTSNVSTETTGQPQTIIDKFGDVQRIYSKELWTPFMHAVKEFRKEERSTHKFAEFMAGKGYLKNVCSSQTVKHQACVCHLAAEEYVTHHVESIVYVNEKKWTDSDLNVQTNNGEESDIGNYNVEKQPMKKKRCPRHLHQQCQKSLEAANNTQQIADTKRSRSLDYDYHLQTNVEKCDEGVNVNLAKSKANKSCGTDAGDFNKRVCVTSNRFLAYVYGLMFATVFCGLNLKYSCS